VSPPAGGPAEGQQKSQQESPQASPGAAPRSQVRTLTNGRRAPKASRSSLLSAGSRAASPDIRGTRRPGDSASGEHGVRRTRCPGSSTSGDLAGREPRVEPRLKPCPRGSSCGDPAVETQPWRPSRGDPAVEVQMGEPAGTGGRRRPTDPGRGGQRSVDGERRIAVRGIRASGGRTGLAQAALRCSSSLGQGPRRSPSRTSRQRRASSCLRDLWSPGRAPVSFPSRALISAAVPSTKTVRPR